MADQDPITHEPSNGSREHPLHFPEKDHLPHTKSVDEIVVNASRATDKEHKMSLWQGIKLYPKAVGWSLLISTCIAMEGYDVCLLSNFCTSCLLACHPATILEITPTYFTDSQLRCSKMDFHSFRRNMVNNYRTAVGRFPRRGNRDSATVPTWVRSSGCSSTDGFRNAMAIDIRS